MEVCLIRHTKPDISTKVCYGQSDLGLAPDFKKAFLDIKEQLPFIPDIIFSSPLKRCRMLSEYIKDDMEVFYDERLKELNFGRWEKQAWNDIPQKELNPWMEDFVNIAPPEGESLMMLHKRVMAWWNALPHQSNKKVIVVTHSGVIRVLLTHLKNLPLKDIYSGLPDVTYGQVISLQDV